MTEFPRKPAWMMHGNCINEPVTTFFLERHDHNANRARAICAFCAVKPECTAYGMTQLHGIWGGLTPRERRNIRVRAA